MNMAERLPQELIAHILKFLCYTDREEASVVCKHWFHASLDPALHRNTKITLRASSSTGKHLQDLGHRKSPKLVITYVEGTNADFLLKEVGRHLGPHLQYLCLKGCDLTQKMFLGILAHCDNLTSLDLSCCNSMFMSGTLLQKDADRQVALQAFRRLKKLSLGSIRYLSDALFNLFVATTPQLEDLSLAGCNIAFETDPYRNRDMGKDSVTLLSFSNLLAFVKRFTSTLTSLDLSLTTVTSEALTSLANVPNFKLRRIVLVRCTHLTDDGVKNLANLQPSLKEVILASCPSVGNVAINAITQNLGSLEKLNLNKLKSIPQDTFEQLTSNLTKLTHLSLASNLNLKGAQMLKGLRGASFSHLRSLNLQGCPQVDDDVVFCICDAAPDLQELNLSSSHAMTDLSVHRISARLHCLKRLNLSWCQRITDFGLLGLDKDCPVISPPDESSKHSSDRYTRSHSNMGFFRPAKFEEVILTIPEDEMQEYLNSTSRVAINAIKTLEYLNLAACHHLTDRCIQESISFPRLQTLDLRMCRNVTDKSLESVAKNNPNLQDLTVSECHQITDVGVTAVAEGLCRLSSLVIPRCLITEKSLDALAQHCRHLKFLDVSQCNVPIAAVDTMRSKLPCLQTVVTSYLDGNLSTMYQPEFF
nr:F-box/LRR-repeat protein 20-like [Lytechinus pictus]